MSETPFCSCGCPNGFGNAKYRETGELRDQWLCADCGKPARQLFLSTDRWKTERWQWYAAQLDRML